MSRKSARKVSFFVIYQMFYQEDFNVTQASQRLFEEITVDGEFCLELGLPENNALSEADRKFILEEGNGTFSNLTEIDKRIAEASTNWSFERIAKTDLAIIRLAVFESFYFNIPKEVSANEAVELAKEYGSDDSSGFVNGILGKIYQLHKV